MDLSIALLVLGAAIVHPLREIILKGAVSPAASYFSVVLVWLVVVTVQVPLAGLDLFTGAAVWPQILWSSLGLACYYVGILVTMRTGDVSVYYPIIRAAPVFIVLANWLVFDTRYGPIMLLGVALVTLGAFLLQYRRGAHPLDAPRMLAPSLLALAGMGIQSLADASAVRIVAPGVLLFWDYLLLVGAAGAYMLLSSGHGRQTASAVLQGWRQRPLPLLAAGLTSYLSYYLVLTAYLRGGEVLAVACLRQASIPLSVLMGGLLLRELHTARRFGSSLVLVSGLVIVIVAAAGD